MWIDTHMADCIGALKVDLGVNLDFHSMKKVLELLKGETDCLM